MAMKRSTQEMSMRRCVISLMIAVVRGAAIAFPALQDCIHPDIRVKEGDICEVQNDSFKVLQCFPDDDGVFVTYVRPSDERAAVAFWQAMDSDLLASLVPASSGTGWYCYLIGLTRSYVDGQSLSRGYFRYVGVRHLKKADDSSLSVKCFVACKSDGTPLKDTNVSECADPMFRPEPEADIEARIRNAMRRGIPFATTLLLDKNIAFKRYGIKDDQRWAWMRHAAEIGDLPCQYYCAVEDVKKSAISYKEFVGILEQLIGQQWEMSNNQQRAIGELAKELGGDRGEMIDAVNTIWREMLTEVRYQLARCYQGKDGNLYDKAFRLFAIAAESGHCEAQTELAHCYHFGRGVARSQQDALKWYRKAAEGGSAMAQNNLGWAYYTGNGVPVDYDRAFSLCSKAAMTGLACAQDSVARCYFYGRGTVKRYSEAYKCFGLSAEQGDSAAMHMLYVCLREGKGCLPDEKKALEWLWKSADAGWIDAQYELGRLYETGILLKMDVDSAIEWYEKVLQHSSEYETCEVIAKAKNHLECLKKNNAK